MTKGEKQTNRIIIKHIKAKQRCGLYITPNQKQKLKEEHLYKENGK